MENLGIKKNFKNFWHNKKIFITGHTGFKGTWLYLYLFFKGAKVYGYSKNYKYNSTIFSKKLFKKNQVIDDVKNYNKLKNSIYKFQPEIVIHMAAQPLVLDSYSNPLDTYLTNFVGTLNILEICRNITKIKSICIVTSDKVYKNLNKIKKYNEKDELLGKDPYSSSKVCAEILTYSYYETFYKNKNISLFTVRAGNVIGGGDWSKNRLIPDIIRSNKNKKKLLVRNPKHSRPWQHVLDVIFIYTKLLEVSYKQNISGGWNVSSNYKKPISVQKISNYN